jgi:signal transduction histidine kinase
MLSFHAPDATGRWAIARLEELERCLRSMAHDLKSPLASLRGLVSLVDGGLRDGLDPTEYTGDLRANVLRVEELVQALVDTCQDAELAKDRRFVPSAQLLHQLALEFKRDLEERGIELVLPANPPAVFANARRFRQVVMNLILNAMQHMGEVDSPRIEIAIEDGGEADVLIVRDNGQGLPPTAQAQILELFRTAAADNDEGWRSSGFGLSIVRRVMRAHGGEVELATEPGHGVQVRATFPRPT